MDCHLDKTLFRDNRTGTCEVTWLFSWRLSVMSSSSTLHRTLRFSLNPIDTPTITAMVMFSKIFSNTKQISSWNSSIKNHYHHTGTLSMLQNKIQFLQDLSNFLRKYLKRIQINWLRTSYSNVYLRHCHLFGGGITHDLELLKILWFFNCISSQTFVFLLLTLLNWWLKSYKCIMSHVTCANLC